MKTSAMELAALASAAVPGLSPTGVAALADDSRDFVSALVRDAKGNQWRVRSPQHAEAAMRLETELQVLSGFSNAVRASLPFHLPSAAGAVRVNDLRTFVYNHVPGQVLDLSELVKAGKKTATDIGRSIAAIHNLAEEVVDLVNLPSYTAEQFRQRRLNELDQAAGTGLIPVDLLRRWEHAMEDHDMWTFDSVVVHGDLHEDNMLFDRGQVCAVMGWTDLHIGDPADDFAWLATSGDDVFKDDVLTSYEQHRAGAADDYLSLRASLSAEFALAQWLLKGLSAGDEQMVNQGKSLLEQLASDIEKFGGQEVSVTPLEPQTRTEEASSEAVDIQEPVEPATSANTESLEETDAAETSENVEDSPAPEDNKDETGENETGEDDSEPAVIMDSDLGKAEPDGPATDAIDVNELKRQQQERLEQAREASSHDPKDAS